jgi:hypothetical protein
MKIDRKLISLKTILFLSYFSPQNLAIWFFHWTVMILPGVLCNFAYVFYFLLYYWIILISSARSFLRYFLEMKFFDVMEDTANAYPVYIFLFLLLVSFCCFCLFKLIEPWFHFQRSFSLAENSFPEFLCSCEWPDNFILHSEVLCGIL